MAKGKKKRRLLVCPDLTDRKFRGDPKHFYFLFSPSIFHYFEIFSIEIDIFGLKIFQKLYLENRKDIYGDRRVKLDCVKSVKTLQSEESVAAL